MRGMAELASHMVDITDWFFGAQAEAVVGSGGVYGYKDGREVPDHTYVTIEYPGGRTAAFTSIESNAFDHYYEAYYGTKGTLILLGETESGSADAAGTARGVGTSAGGGPDHLAAYRHEIDGFCSAIRTGTPLKCGPEAAMASAVACIAGFEAIEAKQRVVVEEA